MSNDLSVRLDPKSKSVEGHTAQCILTFNGRVIWGPCSCHDNTYQLRNALSAADPRFQLIICDKPKTIEGHTYSISVMAGGHVYLDRLSTHDNMTGLCQAINDCLATEHRRCQYISTHGIGAIKDSASSFSITADKGSALVKPTNANQLNGWIHFAIPSPPANNPNLKRVAVDFSSQSASIDTVAVYLANLVKFKEEGLQKNQSFELEITSGQAVYRGKGISVSIFIEFDSINSNLKFQSVGIEV